MHCNCCDRELDDKEIIFNEEIGTWEMCSSCLSISMDAAYCDGFKKEDDEFILIDDDVLTSSVAEYQGRWLEESYD